MEWTAIGRGAMVLGIAALAAGCSKSPTSPSGSGGGADRTLTAVAVSGTATVAEGGTSQLSASATFSDGATQNVTGQATWVSSNPAIVEVSATGLATARRVGAADISASYQGQTGRRTVQVAAAQFTVRVDLQSITALDTCDDVIQGLDNGEFTVRVTAALADGTSQTLEETTGYPGNPSNLRVYNLGRNQSVALSAFRGYTLPGQDGQFVRIQFRATEWDEQIVLIPPSTRWVPDDSMNDRSATRTHAYASGAWSNLGPGSITLGSGSCAIRLNYTVSATR